MPRKFVTGAVESEEVSWYGACQCVENSDEQWAWIDKHDHSGLTNVPEGIVFVYDEERV